MPKLLVFAPCEKVIIDQSENTVSLVTLLGDLQVGVVPGTAVPKDSTTPLHWSAFALWHREASDEGKQYESRCTLVSPNGNILIESGTAVFEMTKAGNNNVHRFLGFPVWEPGKCWLKLWIREVGSSQWNEIASYPIGVIHISPTEMPPL
jgi:hypothetical protein